MKGLLGLLLCCSACLAQGKDDLLQSVRQRVEASDFRATGRLVRVNGSARQTTKFSLRGHWFPDGLRLLYEFETPGGPPSRVLLRMDPHGRVTATGAKDVGVPFEDLAEGQFFWREQTPGAAGSVGTRSCTSITSTPTPADESRYSSVVSCVDPTIGWPLRVTKTARSGSAVDVTYGGLRQSSGVWIASEIRMQAGGPSTLLLIDRGSAKAHLTMKDFDLKAVAPVNAAPVN